MTVKRKTRAQLEQLLAERATAHGDHVGRLQAELQLVRGQRDEQVKSSLDLRSKLDGTKERLAFAEAANQRMRGYLERVQEDDVVREELVTTGSPEGEQRKVPKRKSTIFAPQIDHRVLAFGDDCAIAEGYRNGGRDTRPRHWVTY